jgi:hypothetical protein
MAWRAVLLLMPVALRNYRDRPMLAAMTYSAMADIPGIGTEANGEFMLGQVEFIVPRSAKAELVKATLPVESYVRSLLPARPAGKLNRGALQ